MCVLTRERILQELEAGRLRIEPFDLDQVGPGSIDLHLGDELRVPDGAIDGPLDVLEETEPHTATQPRTLDEPYVLAPGETVQGITRERLTLPPDLCAWIEGRSRFARLGLMVHVTAGFVHPGVANSQVLEMTNVASVPLTLHAGTRI